MRNSAVTRFQRREAPSSGIPAAPIPCGFIIAGLLSAAIALPRPVPASPQAKPAQESGNQATISSTATPFKISVAKNLVLLRVVVRDASGHAVSNLRKEDFLLLDNGRPQAISTFSVDLAAARSAPATPAPEASSGAAPAGAPPADRYVALLFDDVNDSVVRYGNVANLRQSGQAAKAFLAAQVEPGDRIGLFTASGNPEVDFTNDKARIEQALDALRPRPLIDTDS